MVQLELVLLSPAIDTHQYVFNTKNSVQHTMSGLYMCIVKTAHQFRTGRCLVLCDHAAGFSSALLTDSRVCTPQPWSAFLSSMVLNKSESQVTSVALQIDGRRRDKLGRTTCMTRPESLTGGSHCMASTCIAGSARQVPVKLTTSCHENCLCVQGAGAWLASDPESLQSFATHTHGSDGKP